MNRAAALYVRRLAADVAATAPRRAALAIGLMGLSSVFEGLVLALLFPLLALLGLSGDMSFNATIGKIAGVLGQIGIGLDIYSIAALMIGLTLLQHLLFLLQAWIAAGLQVGYTAQWRRQLIDALLRSNWLYFARKNAGELAHVLNFETGRASHLINYGMLVISFLITACAYLAVALLASWQVTLFLLGSCLLILFVSQTIVRRPAQLTARQTLLHTSYSAKSSEVLGGMKLVRAMDGDAAVRRSLWPLIESLRDVERRVVMHPSLLRSSFEVAAVIMLMGTLVLAIDVLKSDGATVLLITALFVRLYPRISTVQQYLHHFRMSVPYYAAVADALDEAVAAAEPRPAGAAKERLGAPPFLRLGGVGVSYGERAALCGVDIDMPARQMVAIAGASGAGKSTLVDVLLGLVPFQQGEISVDGKPLASIDTSTWRRSVGYVPQDTFLFNATIRENIAFAQPDASPAEVEAAAAKAQLAEFIAGLPDGYDTVVGDRGVLLSGGQRQRIGIARALLGGKSLLLLDEATSALDSATETAIMADIAALRGEITIVVIAHRLSTLRQADMIYVLEGGAVVESGSWPELTSRAGHFQRLWTMQTEIPPAAPALSAS
ncbi:MAG TPA: ABC transporter ATP-binding protein [Alphaproteobacteria bacterium]|nr:ABC transporter ATP-binding protein [Alphaproteobacteria bacterium]